MATTIYDIAKRAGVSGSTVSRALNGSRLVSDEVRERVRRVADELGFEKRVVRRHRERVILTVRLVLPHHESPERGLFFDLPTLIAGLRQGFAPTVVNLVCDLGGPDFVPFPHKKGGDTDAFVFAFHRPSAAVVDELAERGAPFVVLNRATPGLPCIAADHARGMEDLVARVVDAGGAARPGLVAIAGMGEIFDERREALRQALERRSLALPEERQWRVEHSDRIDAAHVAAWAGDCDALFCINDIVASALLAQLARLGVRVPEDCQVTGFDDSPLRRLTRPLLTTVAMPVLDFGRRAGRRLAREVIEGSDPAPLERLAGSLVPGGSTRGPQTPFSP